jgi:ParE toxin of type II toxin-antitoxin system, parDE
VCDVKIRPEAQADFRALPNRDLQLEAARFLLALKANPRLGKRLEHRAYTGDLSDCRKIYFDEGPNRSPRYRIVYRLLPDEENPRTVDVIVIGRKAGGSVYPMAVERLDE